MKDRTIMELVVFIIIFVIFATILRYLNFDTQILGVIIFVSLMMILLFFNWKNQQGDFIERIIMTIIIMLSIIILLVNLLTSHTAEFVMPILCIFGPTALMNRDKYLKMEGYVEFTYIMFSMLIVASYLINQQVEFNFITIFTGVNVILSILLMTYILIRFKKMNS